MIIVRISDGLGNQLFQYAYAKMLEKNTKHKVYLDIRYINNEDKTDNPVRKKWIEKCDTRQYRLNYYKISLMTAPEEKLIHWDKTPRSLFRKYCTELRLSHQICLIDNEAEREDNKWSLLHNYYLEGGFFNLNYLNDVRDIIAKEIVLKQEELFPSELSDIIENEVSVSVHVRRGDFLNVGRNISESTYYKKAIDFIKQKVDNPFFIVFSDDMEWVRKNFLKEQNMIYADTFGLMDYEELILMKKCKHNIIANSTFSYWGAWLNNNPNKIVISPKGWRRKIIPDDWLTLW